MSRSYEQSYYEIALTHRQVVVAFVILLGCLVAAFFSGVWVGREGTARADERVPVAEEPTEVDLEEVLGELRFFSDEEEGGTGAPEGDEAGDGSEGDRAAAEPPPPPPPPPPPVEVPPEEPERRAAAPPPPPPATSSRISEGGVVIQVFSSHDEAQANRMLERLEQAGLDAFLSPTDVDGRRVYRVRVGPYGDRGEAERMARRLRRDFKLDTWITQ